MGLPQAQRQTTGPDPVMVAEAAVLVAVGVLGLVLLPQEVERHPFAAQLPMHGRPVGFGALVRGRRR